MNAAWNHIVRSIFEQPDVEKISLEELDYLLEEYPYFPVIHFLRTNKLLTENIPPESASISRTALYFQNPHWLNHQLYEKEILQPSDEPMAEILLNPSYTDELSLVIPEDAFIPEAEVKLEESEMKFDDKRVYPKNAEEEYIQVEKPFEEPVHILNTELPEAIPEELPVTMVFQKIVPEPELTFDIPLEPLFAIDYFASQGIKLRQEDDKQDSLSIKLRSFTEWLKAMKKIHPEKLDQKMDQEQEKNIRETAEQSNAQNDLFTEALAEVYLKQGLHQKAVAVYEKLSLLDPSKSAYFAARIREIKEN
jgi:hypothetical protein